MRTTGKRCCMEVLYMPPWQGSKRMHTVARLMVLP